MGTVKKETKKEAVCQNCQNHKNNPSRCAFGQFVPRKGPICSDYKAK